MPQITVRAVAASQQFVPPFVRTTYAAVSKGKNPLPDSLMTRREAGFLQFSGRFFDIAPHWPSGRMGMSGHAPHNRSVLPATRAAPIRCHPRRRPLFASTKTHCHLMFLHPQLVEIPFVFDEAKDLSNRLKHGVSLRMAEFAQWEAARTWVDTRRNYGETRWICLVPIGARLYTAIVVPRGRTLRVVSLRKANNREMSRYEEGG
ncbi:BrnT family toxin [Burkholderia sp. MSMB2157WGS]|uniref:BrnT family toxin n=1 Tax=Burkholderia sp. MSMB2157WGS TaxID=1637928 RepID=UPI00211D5E71|nr:BrnT family toxin [Burkholderia sp. MSMB2157WGS]